MDIGIVSSTLFTKNIKTYAQFLSNLLEIEVKDNSFSFSGMNFSVIENSKFKIKKDNFPTICFAVNSMEALNDFKAKYEFYMFRVMNKEIDIPITKDSKQYSLKLVDPDDRVLQITYTPVRFS